MENPFREIRSFVRSLGLVEQSQVVASTVVVVSMVTIIAAILATGQTPRLSDFISILTVGTIGSVGVYFSLRYSRQLDDQRRQLLAINTIAEAVNREAELTLVLQTALDNAVDLLNAQFGWIYLLEGNSPVLRCSKGTDQEFYHQEAAASGLPPWFLEPIVIREKISSSPGKIIQRLKDLGIQSWASVPLLTQGTVSGGLIVAGDDYETLTPKQAELLQAFGNQISVAIHKAQLFDLLRRSERRYADLFENSPDIYFSVDSDQVITGCNTLGADMLGYAKQEIIGRSFETFFTPERREDVRTLLARVFNDGLSLTNVEEKMVTASDRQLDVHLNSSLVFDESGRTVFARIVARDITERKRMESAILHAQKIDSIGNLAGGIAHDFNNILASILGSASIMRKRTTARAKSRKYIEIIETAARRGSSLTRQLLTFARKTETRVQPVNVNGIITDTLHLFQRSVSKGIVVQPNLTTDGTDIKGDEGQIQQGLLNLFLNARDAMPSGGTLAITTEAVMADAHTTSQFSSMQPGPFIKITVSDTGTGIDKAVQQRVFEPFFTTKDHGTGLGLSVLYGVVQNHGGFITLESEPGRGTTFSIYLPRLTRERPAATRQRRQRIPRGSENILVIDDEVSVCEIARDMLTDLGYSVNCVHDGRTGVDFYRQRRASIDCILLDVNMPQMGGEEAFAQLRGINPDLPIIILTGYGRNVVEASRFESAIGGFLQKPFQVEDLALKVRQILDATQDSGALTMAP